ncbi:MAG: lytic transglycosylase domain-containing protein [Bacteriovorax sp.]|nr:lytic transglycosylase domain-containing protein [Bacteriovorax sp.]
MEKGKKIHPWRFCPPGRHWVKIHPLHIPPSNKNPAGSETVRHEHCADNPSGKDQLYPDEISEIANQYFLKLENMPCSIPLGFDSGNRFDSFISGWTKYWNDVLMPTEPLDPNLIKALIASESGFNPLELADKKNSNSARGLTQVTNDTRKILGNEKGELKDHYLTLTKKNLNDPNINIAAGVRWLFQKKKLAEGQLGRSVSWIEAVAKYKSVLKDYINSTPKGKKNMGPFLKYLEELKSCKKT